MPNDGRTHTAMYLGSTGFAGLATYIFSTFDLLINCGATFIDVAINADDYEFKSDAQLSIGINSHGDFTIDDGRPGHMGFYSASLLFALSESLEIHANDGDSEVSTRYEKGLQQSHERSVAVQQSTSTTIRLTPDFEIFTAKEISPFAISHFIRQQSYVNPKVRFRVSHDGTTREFCSENGLVDLFEADCANVDILHRPIHIRGRRHDVELELIFAFLGSIESETCSLCNGSFGINKGTHIDGLQDAMEVLRSEFNVPISQWGTVGVFAILAIHRPGLMISGPRPDEVFDHDLREIVKTLVLRESRDWIGQHPEVQRQLACLEPVKFFRNGPR